MFGSLAYVHVPKEIRKKLDRKSRECIFLGYSSISKAYRLWSYDQQLLITSRDVIFDEDSFISSGMKESHVSLECLFPNDSVTPVAVSSSSPGQPLIDPSTSTHTGINHDDVGLSPSPASNHHVDQPLSPSITGRSLSPTISGSVGVHFSSGSIASESDSTPCNADSLSTQSQ